MPETILFYLFSGVLLAAALSVVFSRQPIYSVLSLLVAMFCLAALFVLLGAYFIAALQILLYAGAVLVLFLFVIMLLNLEPEMLTRMRPFTLRGIGTLVAGLLCAGLIRLFTSSTTIPSLTSNALPIGNVETVGQALFTTYLLPFELTSFLILAALIAAITLARSKHQ